MSLLNDNASIYLTVFPCRYPISSPSPNKCFNISPRRITLSLLEIPHLNVDLILRRKLRESICLICACEALCRKVIKFSAKMLFLSEAGGISYGTSIFMLRKLQSISRLPSRHENNNAREFHILQQVCTAEKASFTAIQNNHECLMITRKLHRESQTINQPNRAYK